MNYIKWPASVAVICVTLCPAPACAWNSFTISFDEDDTQEIGATTLINNTGQDANDLHVEVRFVSDNQAGDPLHTIQDIFATDPGSEMQSSPFEFATYGNVAEGLFSADFTDGVVPAGDSVLVSWTSRATRLEGPRTTYESRMTSHYFTRDGVSIGEGLDPGVTFRADAVEGGAQISVTNHNAEIIVGGTRFWSAPRQYFTPQDMKSAAAFLQAEFYDGIFQPVFTALPGQTTVVGTIPSDFLPTRAGPQNTPNSNTLLGAGGGSAFPGLEGVVRGERYLGFSADIRSPSRDLGFVAYGLLFIPEPHVVAIILTMGGALVLRRGRQK